MLNGEKTRYNLHFKITFLTPERMEFEHRETSCRSGTVFQGKDNKNWLV